MAAALEARFQRLRGVTHWVFVVHWLVGKREARLLNKREAELKKPKAKITKKTRANLRFADMCPAVRSYESCWSPASSTRPERQAFLDG